MDDIPYGYCRCGCQRLTNIAHVDNPKYGHVRGEPLPFLRNHRKRSRGYQATDTGFSTPCLLWDGYVDRWGYGHADKGGRSDREVLVHRRAYIDKVGPIPPGYTIHHKCHQPACCEPGHLELLTASDHSKLHPSARHKTCKRGHPLSGTHLYIDPDGGRHCRTCKRETNAWGRRRARHRPG